MMKPPWGSWWLLAPATACFQFSVLSAHEPAGSQNPWNMAQLSFFYNANVYVFSSFMMDVNFFCFLCSYYNVVGQEGLDPRHLIFLLQDLTGKLISI